VHGASHSSAWILSSGGGGGGCQTLLVNFNQQKKNNTSPGPWYQSAIVSIRLSRFRSCGGWAGSESHCSMEPRPAPGGDGKIGGRGGQERVPPPVPTPPRGMIQTGTRTEMGGGPGTQSRGSDWGSRVSSHLGAPFGVYGKKRNQNVWLHRIFCGQNTNVIGVEKKLHSPLSMGSWPGASRLVRQMGRL